MATTTQIVGTIALASVALVMLANVFLSPKFDPREPPVLRPTIPFVGHIISLLRRGPLFLRELSTTCKHPVFTLPMMNSRTYIVASPEFASHVQRASSTLDFGQLLVEMAPRMVGLSAEGKAILEGREAIQEGRERMIEQAHHVINPRLFPSDMEGIGSSQLQQFNAHFHSLADGLETELYRLTTRLVTVATQHTFFGPENPFAMDPSLIEDFWTWESGIIGYMMGILPQWTVRDAYRGLEKCTSAFMEYAKKGRYVQASRLIRDRQQLHESNGVSLEDQARLEVAISMGFNVNAGISTFWVVNNIFSRPSLLVEIREEIAAHAVTAPKTISFAKLRDACPLLNSVYRETLRNTANLTSARWVKADTLIADTYLLKANTVVQIAGPIIHTDAATWGSDALSFNPRRFIHNLSGTKSLPDGTIPPTATKQNNVHPAAFRGFGGGSTLCPGRHFAQMEIICMTALLVMGWELGPVAGEKAVGWNPERDDAKFTIAVTKPVSEVRVKMERREKSARWEVCY
ncbi:cytochrome P450 [Amniculicola lignicola CBS 123094]|uniref:Cytochrome P450 n=1 Tax=Amniculicola lignicola CBS 123094 TaxID=1392246 RepID=A0A6A5VYT4_9PLEO|nr:cytochrome P450 [Amniculicola lignicola CBS 123094]